MTLSVDILLNRAIQERIATALETQIAEDGADGFTVTYMFTVEDCGGGSDWTQDIQAPTGYRGKVVAVTIIDVFEAFVGTTSTGPLDVGIQAGDQDAYAISEQVSATLSVADATEALSVKEGVVGTIPSAKDLIITYNKNVGGSITGQATFLVTIKYFI